jgi:thymidylate synthase
MNHLDQAKEQLSRTPATLPSMALNPDIHNIFDFTFDDFELRDYHPQAHIPAKVAV